MSGTSGKGVLGQRAVVMGAGLAGTLAAKVLSDYFSEVLVIERDSLETGLGRASLPSRPGLPQGNHPHIMLMKGSRTLESIFPGILEEFSNRECAKFNMTRQLTWRCFGGTRKNCDGDIEVISQSRPYLEEHLRKRVRDIQNIVWREKIAVRNLILDSSQQRVAGIAVSSKGGESFESIPADFVVDTMGRGSKSVEWLKEAGFTPPKEETVKINVIYVTGCFENTLGESAAGPIIISAVPPHGRRAGILVPIEKRRVLVAMVGLLGESPPLDEEGFRAYAASLSGIEISDELQHARLLTKILSFRHPESRRWYFENLTEYPEGFIALGDSICCLNPLYGQGLTSTILQAEVLSQQLNASRLKDILETSFYRDYYKQVARIVSRFWRISKIEDLRFPVEGSSLPPVGRIFQKYLLKVHRATHEDEAVFRTFAEVMNLEKGPGSLLSPRMMMKVCRY